ncbi:hypothetical protein G432_09650 [Sphingomonas sp. MM-1]|nr:hypothetical protein G432_09650 [Sphingomonas sp. MM-1]
MRYSFISLLIALAYGSDDRTEFLAAFRSIEPLIPDDKASIVHCIEPGILFRAEAYSQAALNILRIQFERIFHAFQLSRRSPIDVGLPVKPFIGCCDQIAIAVSYLLQIDIGHHSRRRLAFWYRIKR